MNLEKLKNNLLDRLSVFWETNIDDLPIHIQCHIADRLPVITDLREQLLAGQTQDTYTNLHHTLTYLEELIKASGDRQEAIQNSQKRLDIFQENSDDVKR